MSYVLEGYAWKAKEAPLESFRYEVREIPAGEALVEVAGCGVCHTDISFAFMGVPTRQPPPLVLGHEISGRVLEVGPGADVSLKGKAVLVPAVLPCGECELCRSGMRRICRKQVMPGNDRHGGFARQVVVPARYLCPVPDRLLESHQLWELAIVSDAVATPFQSVKLSGLRSGDLAICIGVGGIGIHGVQVAAAAGGKVVALDIDDGKLEAARQAGAAELINVRDLSEKDLKARVRQAAKNLGASEFGWKIFETSGTRPGQLTAFSLLGFGGTMMAVGFTLDKVEVRLSNLMAFDARIIGHWGADPEIYPEVLEWLAAGRIKVKPFVEKHALAEINQVMQDAHHGRLKRRAVLVP